MNKKVICIVILGIFLLANSFVSAQMLTASEEFSTTGLNEIIIKGFELKAYEDDVKEYGDNCVRLSEGSFRGIAYYLLSVGEFCDVKEGMQIGIEYKDTSLLGSGPSVYLCDFDLRDPKDPDKGWSCIMDNVGKTGSFRWEWRTSSNSDKYVLEDMGLIFIKVVADELDDTIISNIGIRYDFNKEPLFNYDPYIGYGSIAPSKGIEFNPNPNFDGQRITFPHTNNVVVEGNLFCCFFQILEEDFNDLVIVEEWECRIFSLECTEDHCSADLKIREDRLFTTDNRGVYLLISNEYMPTWETRNYGEGYGTFTIDINYIQWLDVDFLILKESYDYRQSVMYFKVENQKPTKPTIEGPSQVKPGETTEFKITSTDPDGDLIQYCVDWNNDCHADTFWTIECESGQPHTISNTWDLKGTYAIRVIARDTYFKEYNYESDWSDPFTFKVSRSKTVTTPSFNSIFAKLFDQFPVLKQFFLQG